LDQYQHLPAAGKQTDFQTLMKLKEIEKKCFILFPLIYTLFLVLSVQSKLLIINAYCQENQIANYHCRKRTSSQRLLLKFFNGKIVPIDLLFHTLYLSIQLLPPSYHQQALV